MGRRQIVTAKGPRDGLGTTRVVMSRKLHLRQLRVFYSEAGVGAPTIMVHGLAGSSRWWFSLFPELTSANLRVVAPDLPGFGRSPGPALDLPGAARAIVDVADHLGFGQFFLCGHSMGGAIAAQIAADFRGRVRRMVLINSAGIPAARRGLVLLRFMQPWTWCPMHFLPTLVGDVLKTGPKTIFSSIQGLRDLDIRPAIERVRVPTLVLWGEKDRLTPPEHGRLIADTMVSARFETIPGARHVPMASHPQIVARSIVEFFREDLKPRK